MKKLSVLMLIFAFVALGFSACEKKSKASVEDKAAAEAPMRIALILDPVGINPFLTQMVDKLAEMKAEGEFNFEYSVIECADSAAWAENIRASVEEGYDFVCVAGWQGADPLDAVADQFPDAAQYAIIDVVCDNPKVKSYIFKPAEGAFLIGAIAASVSADAGQPNGPFGAVHVNPGQGSFEWRYGYMEGARAINPDLSMDDFLFNYTKSFTDAVLAKELALQQAAQNCVFINAASAVADFGTFEAAAEKGFYTSGQDADRTNPENPYILTTQVKYTGVVMELAVREFFDTGIQPGIASFGLTEGVVGATYITDDGTNPRNKDILTDEIVETVRGFAEKIKSGEISVDVPLEDTYSF